MMEIMGHFLKTECHWELIKKCDSESHKPQDFIDNIEIRAVTKFYYLMMNRKVEFQIKKFSAWFQKLIMSLGPPFNFWSFRSVQTSSLDFGL